MANEAALRVRTNTPLPFTVADGTAITKGAVLALSDPRTAATNTSNGGMLAGIAARDKAASDGRTELAVYRKGWFDMTTSGTVTLGEALTCYHNKIQTAAVTASGAALLGTALETGSDGETILVEVNIGTGGTARG